jgi:hypothetical protein
MQFTDVTTVVAMVQRQIEEDAASGREPRLGPLSEPLLNLSLEEFPGLSSVLEDQDSGELRGCALITAFEAIGHKRSQRPLDIAEAAKLTVRRPFLGTEGASILHALRVVGTAIQEPYDRKLKLIYNVLSNNEGQLRYMRDLAFDPITPTGHLAKVLDQRQRKLELGGQRILTFTPSSQTVDQAIAILLEAAADGVLMRMDRDSPSPHLQAWELTLAHPLVTDELEILIDFARERGVAVPRHIVARLPRIPAARAIN